MKVAQSLLGGVFVVVALTMIVFTPSHAVEFGWTVHATVHLLQGVFWLVGLCIVGIVLTVFPLGHGETWAWWTLLFIGAIIFGGYFTPYLLFIGQGVGLMDIAGFGVFIAVYVMGLGIAWRRLSRLSL